MVINLLLIYDIIIDITTCQYCTICYRYGMVCIISGLLGAHST